MGARERPAFGELLRTLRTAAGLSQENLAERTGLSVRGISDLERGARTTPRLQTVSLLADGLALDASTRAALLAAARPSLPFPPIVSHEPDVPHLPRPPTSLIGREREVAEVAEFLLKPSARLLTVTGAGGVGKTRLALEVASQVGDRFADGVCFVELAPLGNADLVPGTVAHALGVREAPGGVPVDDIVAFLHNRQILLVLDNFEHVLAAGSMVARIIAACSGVRVLVTSRMPLRVRGEQEWLLHPLSLPDADANDSRTWLQADAVRLFVERASAVRPELEMAGAEARAVSHLCLRLDGLPLALELAAAHVKLFPPSALLAKLEHERLSLLSHGAADLPPRQQTMRRTIAWSYHLLDPPGQTLFRRLAVFAGGWTMEGAEAVVDPDGDLAVSAAMIDLLNSSLIRHGYADGPNVRLEMLETVREFGVEQLALSGEDAHTRDAHAAWVLDLVEQAGRELVGPRRSQWMGRLHQEIGNLRAALAWGWSRGDPDLVIRLAAPVWHFWFGSGYAEEGRAWLLRALDSQNNTPSEVRAEGFYAAGSLAATLVDREGTRACLREALAIWRALENPAGVGRVLQILGTHSLEADESRDAVTLLEQAIAAYEASADMPRSPWYALAHSELAVAALRLGQLDRAMELGEKALLLQRRSGSQLGEGLALVSLGDIAFGHRNLGDACRWYLEGLSLLLQIGEEWYLAHVLRGFVILLTEIGLMDAAARVAGAQEAALLATGHRIFARHQHAHDSAMARMIATLGEEAVARASADGASVGLEEAVGQALQPLADWIASHPRNG